MTAYRYAKNIPLHYGFTILMNLSFTHGLWMIYLAHRGFSLMQLGLLEAFFHVTSFLMEVPTGTVADIWGRKASRIAGRFAYAASLFCMFYAQSFSLQLVAFALSALGYNLESGAGDAFLYDSLLLDERESSYMKIKGMDELFYQICAIVSFILGGVLASIDYALAFALTIASSLLAFGFGWFFKEPQLSKKKKNSETRYALQIFISIKTQIQDSVRVFRTTKKIAFLILFCETLFAFMVCLFFYLQNFWTQKGYGVDYIGYVFALHASVAALFSFKASVIEAKIGQKGVLFGCPLLLLICLWGVSLPGYSMVFYISLGAVEGLLAPTISSYLNVLIPSEFRATILSFQSMAYSLFMIVMFPLIGWIAASFSLETAFLVMAAVATLLALLFVLILRRTFVTSR
ncbi:MAG: MFS transporter [Spirochaetia bacterium]|nr:MFS transporter [Spirochaetia bacterium]